MKFWASKRAACPGIKIVPFKCMLCINKSIDKIYLCVSLLLMVCHYNKHIYFACAQIKEKFLEHKLYLSVKHQRWAFILMIINHCFVSWSSAHHAHIVFNINNMQIMI